MLDPASVSVKTISVQWVHRMHDHGCNTKRERGRWHLPGERNAPQTLSKAIAANAESWCPESSSVTTPSEKESNHAHVFVEPIDGVNPSALHQKIPLGRGSTEKSTKIKGCEKGGNPRCAGREIRTHGIRDTQLSNCGSTTEEKTEDIESTSEYGDESFESTESAESAPVALSTAENEVAGNRVHDEILRGDVGVNIDGISLSAKSYRTEGEGLRGAKRAGVVKIEACWRGFLGRCEAKCLLRSILHNALRTLGAGRMSKVRLKHGRW